MNSALLRTGLLAGVLLTGLWTAAPASATRRAAAPDARLWVGSTSLDHVAGQVSEDVLLGVNFGVVISGDDIPATNRIVVTLDLGQVAGFTVITGLTDACGYLPKVISCTLDPTDPDTLLQSMTMRAADGAPDRATGTIALTAQWADDVDAANNAATIDLSVVSPSAPGPTDIKPLVAPAATQPAPPTVIDPLPPAPAVSSTPHGSGQTPRPSVLLTSAPRRNPTPVTTPTADSRPNVVAGGTAHADLDTAATVQESPWRSRLMAASFAAGAAVLLAACAFALANLRRG